MLDFPPPPCYISYDDNYLYRTPDQAGKRHLSNPLTFPANVHTSAELPNRALQTRPDAKLSVYWKSLRNDHLAINSPNKLCSMS